MVQVIDVKPLRDFKLEVTFDNKEAKIFDVKPYLDKGIFTELQQKDIFDSVKVFMGSIMWPNGQDFGPDTLYLESSFDHVLHEVG